MSTQHTLHQLFRQFQALGMETIYIPDDVREIMNPPGKQKKLDTLFDSIRDCTLCKLCKGRKQVVFGVGSAEADLVFVGEGPGADEDRQGIPFVGRAGQLLTKMIESGMGIQRSSVYICNVVKCRPPDNRNPELEEIVACEPFLKQQLEIIQPKVIVGLGKFAVQTLLQTSAPISRLRGHWHEYDGIPFMPTFHPAYLLRNQAGKADAWADLQQVMKKLGIPLPSKKSS